jgi:site-specific DNA-methyltransferase (adenine-specific)/adenine-specific DNA-methyltransferase
VQLDDELKQQLLNLIKEGKDIPESFKNILFPPKEESKEIELRYGIKEREEDILADTMAMPFQPVKQFGTIKEGEWHNMLIFGDNLQALKYLKKLQDEGKLEKIKLIYIDPPFGTGDIYDAKGEPAYSAAMKGAEFVEFLRKRLIFLREILADDGSIYLRIDYHFGHYIKVIMDEIFGKNNFQNEIVVNRIKKSDTRANRFNTATDSVFFYSRTSNYIFKGFRKKLDIRKEERWHAMDSQGPGPARTFFGKKLNPPFQRHWTFTQENIDVMIKENRIRLKCRNCGYIHDKGEWRRCPKCKKDDPRPEYRLGPTETQLLDSNWTDIPGYTFQWDYPTENSEVLLERVIKASSNPGDLVLDCFAGSGTTGAVAEKLGRRWIMVDSSKLAIYTIIKRLHNLKKEIGNKGQPLKPKPFVLYNAGLYEDHDFILKMGEENFKKFSLELFQAEPKDFEINGLKMDGVLLNCPVKVFSQKGYLTEEYIDQLHENVGDYIKARMFIIAPASRVYFLQDYIEKDGIRYYILRIPYSIIDELHKRTFRRPLQPTSAKDINQNIEQVGFDFIRPPNVKAEYYRRTPKDKLIEEELIIEIKEFEAIQRAKEPEELKDPKDALSMVLIDKDYNGKFFNMTDYFFAEDIKKEGYKVRIPATNLGQKVCIIYLDIFGNERIEVKEIKEFKRR